MLSSLAHLELRKKEEGLVPGFPDAKSPQLHLKKRSEEEKEKKEKEKMEMEKKEMEKQGAAQEKQMKALMGGLEEALCGDEPLIVPEFEGSHESLYLDGSFSDLEFLPSVTACGEGGLFPRLFKLEDLLALEEAQGQMLATIEQEPPRVLQQGPDGHFDWVSATIDLNQLPQYEETPVLEEEEEDPSSSSRMPSPSPSPAAELLPLPPALSSKKRKGAPQAETPLPPLPPKKRKIGVVMDAEEKRERNRVSALKYRQKQRSGAYVTEDRIVELERENQLLHFEIMKEKQAIAELRQLLTKHGVIPS